MAACEVLVYSLSIGCVLIIKIYLGRKSLCFRFNRPSASENGFFPEFSDFFLHRLPTFGKAVLNMYIVPEEDREYNMVDCSLSLALSGRTL